MSDSVLLSAAFSMLETAVAVSRRGKIVYMNPAAVGLAAHFKQPGRQLCYDGAHRLKKLHGEGKLGKRIPHPRHKLRRFSHITQRQRF